MVNDYVGELKKATYEDVKKRRIGTTFVNIDRCGWRRLYIDERGQFYIKCGGDWWKFPEEKGEWEGW